MPPRDIQLVPNPYAHNAVTIGVTPHDMAPLKRPKHRERIMGRHNGEADEVTVLVPPGMGMDAMKRIWAALEATPNLPEESFELMQATAYDNNIRRMYGSL